MRYTRLILLGSVVLATAPLHAHHGAAAYDVSREARIAGTVKEWRWSSPHTWVFLTATSAQGTGTEEWSGEGPPLTWAAQRGWSPSTLARGERVTLVMYPARDEQRAGLVKRIERASGETLVVSRPWLDGGR